MRLAQKAQDFRRTLWLERAREIQALAQTGLHYSKDRYDQERYQRLLQIAAEITADHTNLDSDRLTQVFQQQIGYATPRVDVRGAVFERGKLLLVQERIDGGWTMPGGWADVGDTPSGAIEREVWEESGFRVKTRKVVGIYDANRIPPLEVFHAFKIVFLCDILSGAPRISNETSEVAFFSEAEIPDALSCQRTSPRHIHDAFLSYSQPGSLAQYD